ncbi:oligopeptide ABC transporter substrate-binding protein [Isobaculum melis]|nr:oligopeptide ABC transporter substrate-binding protein [Isobaculum melis]
MKKKGTSLLVSLATVSLVLAACGGGNKSGGNDASKDNGKENVDKSLFPIETSNDKDAIKGGTLNVALVSDSAFKGIFSQEFNDDAYDSKIFQFNVEPLYTYDDNFAITNDGPTEVKFDEKAKTATITIKDGVKWSDGEALKAEDIAYTYEVVGHKDYDGVRYDETFKNIVGMEAYHEGTAKTISGITIKDDQTVVIEYQEVSPAMLNAGGGIWSGVLPKHNLKDVPVKEMAASDQIRKNPVTLGPFKVSNIVAGESVEFVPNEHYYKGKPKLDKVVLKRIPSDSIVASLKAGEYDVALSMPTDIYKSYEDLENTTILGREELSYTYIGFKLGTLDKEKGEVVTDPKAKMADVKLRQAMAYAVNNDEVGEAFYSGLRQNATTLIPPAFAGYHDKDLKGYTQDIDKANELLDEAGYKDVNGDGIREDKDGKPFEINFASMSGGEVAEPLAQYYIQCWEEVGLKVVLSTGRLIEFNSFYDKVKADDKDIDIFQAAWSVGTDPTPTGLYGRDSEFNFSRFATKDLDKLLKDITSEKSFDEEYRVKAFTAWQEYMAEELPVIPTLYRYETLPVSNRVKNLDWHYGATQWQNVELTAETTEK